MEPTGHLRISPLPQSSTSTVLTTSSNASTVTSSAATTATASPMTSSSRTNDERYKHRQYNRPLKYFQRNYIDRNYADQCNRYKLKHSFFNRYYNRHFDELNRRDHPFYFNRRPGKVMNNVCLSGFQPM